MKTKVAEQQTLSFTCNICSTDIPNCPVERLDRELVSCPTCGSTVRWRSIVHLLSIALYGESIALREFPRDTSIRGVGLSDSHLYAEPLEKKFSYINTYIHQEPLLDIEDPQPAYLGVHDFMISADVFEHVLPPASRAFDNSFRLLKPGGHLILTLPFSNDEKTIEHFPDVKDFRIVDFDGKSVMVHRDHHDNYSVRTELVFHGGQGDTLEMRVFSRKNILELLANAGFTDIKVFEEPVARWGLVNKCPWALPILARRPG